MFEARLENNNTLFLSGRLDASQTDKAASALNAIQESGVIDFSDLEYISSAGIGVLLAAQRRLQDNGARLKLTNMSAHIRDIFRYAGLDRVFEIE